MSLEHFVHLHYDTRDGNDYSPVSFAHLTALDYLKVSSVLYLGGKDDRTIYSLLQTFPPTLKGLHITYIGEKQEDNIYPAVLDAFWQVLEQREQLLPNLGDLTLERSLGNQHEKVDKVREMLRYARGKGISLYLISQGYRRAYDGEFERYWVIDERVQWQECVDDREGW